MLWPLSWDDGNWQSMFHTLGMNNYALFVVMRRWQLTELFHTWMIYYHVLTVVIRRWQLTEHVSYFRDIYHHALTVLMSRWQLTEHDWYLRDILPCSDCCHEMMTTDGAFFIPSVCITMLCPLSWDDDNWQNMFQCEWYITTLWPLS